MQLKDKIRTEQHTTAPAYDFTRTLVAQSLVRLAHRPRISKSSVNAINAHSMRIESIPLDAHSDAHYCVNTPLDM